MKLMKLKLRAALLLLVTMLTAQTAWADDANYYTITHDATVVLEVADADMLVQDGVTYYRAGADIRFSFTPPNPFSKLESFSVSTRMLELTYFMSGEQYVFTMPSSNVTITTSWTSNYYCIHAEQGISVSTAEADNMTLNNVTYYKKGATVTVTVTPPADKVLKGISVTETNSGNNVSFTQTGNRTFTFTMPAADVSLTATYVDDSQVMALIEGPSVFTVTSGISQGRISTYTYYSTDPSGDEKEGCTRLLDGKYSSTDPKDYSKWCVSVTNNQTFGQATFYVEFNTAKPVIPKKYVLITGDDNDKKPGRNPKTWKVQAKVNASDTGWETIANVTNDFTMKDVNFTPYTFEFNNPDDKAYQYFHFEVYGTQGIGEEGAPDYTFTHDYLQLSEMQMWVKHAEQLTTNSAGIMTYASTKDLDFSQATSETDGATLKAYIVNAFDGSALTLSSVDVVPAQTGLLLKGTPSTTFTVPFTTNASAPTTNYLVGVTDAATVVPVTENGKTNFILANGKYGIDWYTLSKAGAIGANKAYLSLPPSTTSSGFTWVYDDEDGNEATGVKTTNYTNYTNYDDAWYDMQGRRIAKPTQKGVYVHNGRKVVVK